MTLPLNNSYLQIDRLFNKLQNEVWIKEILSSSSARFIPICDDHFLINNKTKKAAVFSNEDIKKLKGKISSIVLLGKVKSKVYFSIVLKKKPIDSNHSLLSLRKVIGLIPEQESLLLAYAGALNIWINNNRFCGKCGSKTKLKELGHRIICTNNNCLYEQFPRIDPAIICLITYKNKCLLVRQSSWPDKRYALVAGFVEPAESLEDAVKREVKEETGLELKKITYFGSQPWPFPSSIMLAFTAEAENDKIEIDNNELSDAKWMSRKEIMAELNSNKLLPPTNYSVAFKLLEDWFNKNSRYNLKEILELLRKEKGK